MTHRREPYCAGDRPFCARDSNLEVLRILAMLLIVFHHAFYWGGMELPGSPDLNTVVYAVGRLSGQVGVLVFFLITGYFMIRQRFTVRKLVRMVLEIWFYSWTIAAVMVLTGQADPLESVLCLFPLMTGEWWFIEAYLALMVLSPFVNRILNSVTKREYLLITGVLFFLTYVLYLAEMGPRYCAAFGTAVTVYCIAGYIRLYPTDALRGMRTGAILLSIGILADVIALTVLFSVCYDMFPIAIDIMDERTCLPELLVALGMFLIFLNMRGRSVPWVNYIASSTFAVYLIHQAAPVKHVLWSAWLDMGAAFQYDWFPLYVIGCTLLVFSMCIAIDKLRIGLVFGPMRRRIDDLSEMIERYLEGLLSEG